MLRRSYGLRITGPDVRGRVGPRRRGHRDQERCLPETPPYGCKGEWASIYTFNQNATYGALFIRFNAGGDPNKAFGYFKNIDGGVIDQFDILRGP